MENWLAFTRQYEYFENTKIMNTELLEQHNVNFEMISGSNRHFNATGNGIAFFLSEFFAAYGESSYQEAIDLIDIYLNGGEHPLGDNSLGVNSDQVSVWLDNETAEVYDDTDPSGTTVLQTLPLQDFKDIMIMAWEFINS